MPGDLIMTIPNVHYYCEPDYTAADIDLVLGWRLQEEVVERSTTLEKAVRTKKLTNQKTFSKWAYNTNSKIRRENC